MKCNPNSYSDSFQALHLKNLTHRNASFVTSAKFTLVRSIWGYFSLKMLELPANYVLCHPSLRHKRAEARGL